MWFVADVLKREPTRKDVSLIFERATGHSLDFRYSLYDTKIESTRRVHPDAMRASTLSCSLQDWLSVSWG